jgi:hypothetical protein
MDIQFEYYRRNPVVRWINPSLIRHHLAFNRAGIQAFLGNVKDLNARCIKRKRYSGLILSDAVLTKGRPLSRCPHIKALHQRFVQKRPWHRTDYWELYESWYKPLTGRPREYFYFHKLLYWDEIYHDIQKKGYMPSGDPLSNVEVSIGANCEALFVDGRHRLFFAQVLKIPRIPVTINAISRDSMHDFERALRNSSMKAMHKD